MGETMKKFLLLLTMFGISFSSFGLEFSKEYSDQNVIPTIAAEKIAETQLIKPGMGVIYINPQVDFKQVMSSLVQATKNKEIFGILLIVDCNGGDMGAFSALHDLIKKITEIKPVVSLVIGSALSAGYLAIAATDYIVAQMLSGLGCIGVITEIQKYKEVTLKGNLEADLDVEIIYDGEFKAIWHPYKKLSDKERKYVQEYNTKYYQIFLKIVAQDRKLSLADFAEWAEGKLFIADEALQLGLIDEIGTIFEAESKMLELIHKKNPDIRFDTEISQVAL